MSTPKRAAEISSALVFIEEHLDETAGIADIAQRVGLSSFHFQRLFFQHLGENVTEYIRRRRLERGAKLLAMGAAEKSVIEVALESGFESHSAFSRAFKAQYGQSPSVFRRSAAALEYRHGTDNRPFLLPTKADKQLDMVADLLDLPPLWLLYRQQPGVVHGSYFPDRGQLQQAFADLPAGPDDAFWGYCGAYQGGPSAFSDAAAVGCYGGLYSRPPATTWSNLCEPLGAGTWAAVPHYGDFAHLHLTWTRAVRNWLPGSPFSLRDGWAFETYLTGPDDTGGQTVTAQIYLPVHQPG